MTAAEHQVLVAMLIGWSSQLSETISTLYWTRRHARSVFGDAVVATAILDRLLHHSAVINIRGDSYRLREKRRSGLLQKAGPALKTKEAMAI
jgi:DNA replication protein DnaC